MFPPYCKNSNLGTQLCTVHGIPEELVDGRTYQISEWFYDAMLRLQIQWVRIPIPAYWWVRIPNLGLLKHLSSRTSLLPLTIYHRKFQISFFLGYFWLPLWIRIHRSNWTGSGNCYDPCKPNGSGQVSLCSSLDVEKKPTEQNLFRRR